MNLHNPVKTLSADKLTELTLFICCWISLETLLKYVNVVGVIPLSEVLNFKTLVSVVPVINVVGVVKETFVNLFVNVVMFDVAVDKSVDNVVKRFSAGLVNDNVCVIALLKFTTLKPFNVPVNSKRFDICV